MTPRVFKDRTTGLWQVAANTALTQTAASWAEALKVAYDATLRDSQHETEAHKKACYLEEYPHFAAILGHHKALTRLGTVYNINPRTIEKALTTGNNTP